MTVFTAVKPFPWTRAEVFENKGLFWFSTDNTLGDWVVVVTTLPGARELPHQTTKNFKTKSKAIAFANKATK